MVTWTKMTGQGKRNSFQIYFKVEFIYLDDMMSEIKRGIIGVPG